MKKKRIAIAVPDITFVGGAEKVSINLAKMLSLNNEVTVISLFEWENESSFISKDSKIKNITLGYKKTTSIFERLLLNLKSHKQIQNLFDGFDYVIGSNFFRYYIYPFETKAKLCEIQHLRFEEEGGRDSLLRRLMYKGLYKVIVLTCRDAEKFKLSNYHNIEVIPNFINELNTHVNYRAGSDKILAVGRLTYQKNYEDMLDVMAAVVKNNQVVTLHILGDGGEKDHLESRIIELGLVGRVILHGSVDNVDKHLTEACALISTSRFEGFPLSFLEALNYELPIVTYDFESGARELVQNDVNGIVIKMGDKIQFADKLSDLLNSPEKKLKYSNGARMVKDKYSPGEIIKEWNLKVFKDD